MSQPLLFHHEINDLSIYTWACEATVQCTSLFLTSHFHFLTSLSDIPFLPSQNKRGCEIASQPYDWSISHPLFLCSAHIPGCDKKGWKIEAAIVDRTSQLVTFFELPFSVAVLRVRNSSELKITALPWQPGPEIPIKSWLVLERRQEMGWNLVHRSDGISRTSQFVEESVRS